jgi:hypothetical protein
MAVVESNEIDNGRIQMSMEDISAYYISQKMVLDSLETERVMLFKIKARQEELEVMLKETTAVLEQNAISLQAKDLELYTL